jgi:hypothetical protein
MRIVISSNIGNGIGLEADYRLLRSFLEERGHEVYGQQFDKPATVESCDLCIWLEVINEHLVPISKRHWIFVNGEWLKPEYARPIQRHCEFVFAKTREAERLLKGTFPNVRYVGFLCADKMVKAIPRERKFLHLGGNGGFRNTNEVISAWREYRYWISNDNFDVPLTVVSNSNTVDVHDAPGITFLRRATDERITELQNSHLFHLFPSATEGYGQAIHESQSVGAVLLTTQAPPMSEMQAPFEVPGKIHKKQNFSSLYNVSPSDIRVKAGRMLEQPSHVIARMQAESRARFEKGNREFAERFTPFLEPKSIFGRSLRISLIGNFDPPHSTENDLLWTLRDMGHQVIPFQENQDSTEEILSGSSGSKLCLFIHTHGWVSPGKMSLDRLWEELRKQGTVTASFHLDRYWGLNALDQREEKIGKHAFWKTDFCFTADGGNQERFSARGVNHHWLPPGVVKRECRLGEFRGELSTEIGFIGAVGYHPEYPFRGELINFLRDVYGERFRVYQGYRGQPLNDLYASVKVVVGDSCFGGADRYFSDRVPETLGRGGFLIHPACKGLDIPGLVTFSPGNLYELQDRIDYYLNHESEREHLRCAAHHWVKSWETYSNRMKTLLGVCGLG